MIKTIIIDDEEEAREGVRVLLERDPEVELVAMCKHGLEAINAIYEHQPHLVFLDIQMPEINGFEVLNSIRPEAMPAVIFVTAYDQYAIRAFEVHAIDYLLKPFTDERFYRALTFAKQHIHQKNLNPKLNALLQQYQKENTQAQGDYLIQERASNRPSSNRLVIKSSGKIYFIQLEDIRWIEAYDYYIKIHIEGRFYLVRESMKRMVQKLPENQFARIHKSSIVNLNQIVELEPYFNGEYIVHLQSGEKLKLSRNFKKNLLGRWEEL